MAARLVPQTEGSTAISLEKAITLIGRHPDCDGVLPDNQKISRRHCCIAQVDDRLILRDLGSMNGVTVNGEQVSEIDLKDGDEITIGDEDYILELKAKAPGAKTPARRAKKADPDAPTPERPRPSPKPLNGATAQSASNRRPFPVDISQEFPVPIADDEDSSNDDVYVPRSVNGHPPRSPIPPKVTAQESDDIEDEDNSILKLDSGEIQLWDKNDPKRKK